MKGTDSRNSIYAQWKPAAISCLLVMAYLAAATTLSPAAADPPDPARGPARPAVVPSPSADYTHPLFSPQGTAAIWRDTFDDEGGLEVEKNTQVRQGTLTLGFDDTWVQTTQEDFEAGTLDGRLDTTSVPGSLRLAKPITFTANVRINDDTGSANQFCPAIAVDANGHAYAVWQDERNDSRDIYFSRSTDDGGTWSSNIRLNDDTESASQEYPTIAVDGDGDVYVVWRDRRDGNWDIYFSRSSDEGVTWSPNIKLNDDTGATSQWYPAIAVDGDEDIYVVWWDDRNSEYNHDIYFTRSSDRGVTWSPNVQVNDYTGSAQHPAIAVDGDRDVYVVWEDWRNGDADIYVSRSTDGGATWGLNVRVDDNGAAPQENPAIAVDGDGDVFTVWEDRRSGNWDWDVYVSRSSDGGVTWSPNIRLNDDTGATSQWYPAIAVDGDIYAVWEDDRNGNSDIYVSRSRDGGVTWSPNIRVNDDAGVAGQWRPAIAVGGDGDVDVVWGNFRNGTNDIYFARSLPGTTYFSTGTWTSKVYDAGAVTAWEYITWVATTPVSTTIVFQTRTGDTPIPDHTWSDWSDTYTVPGATITSLPAHHIQLRTTLSTSDTYTTPLLVEAHIHYQPHVWSQTTRPDFETGTMNRLDSASMDGDVILVRAPAFGTNSKVNDDIALVSKYSPAIAVDRDGDGYAVWVDSRNSNWDIYFSRSSGGGVTWSPNIRVSDDAGVAGRWHPAIAVDSNSNAYAVWQDRRNGNYDIYFSRSSDGGVTWSPNIRVNDDTGLTQQNSPAIAVDANGTTYALWWDIRNGNPDIYFSRSTDGGVTWSPNVRLNDDTGLTQQSSPAIAVDVDGDVYAVWEDWRNGDADIYFARSSDGGGTWSPNVQINDDTVPASQEEPVIAVGEDGNIFTVWRDDRNGSQDIYFSRSSDGGVTWSLNIRVNDDTGWAEQWYLAIAVGGDGDVYVVWDDRRNGNWDIYFSHSTDGGVTWSPNVRINDDTGSASQTNPAIVVDADGNAYTVWEDYRDNSNGASDVFFAKSLSGITYADVGTLTSSVHNTSGGVAWGHITWTVTTPTSTTIAFQTRTSDTPTPDEGWSQWSTVYASPGLTITSPLSRYLQYQAVLSTTDPYTTPVLHDVTLDWKQYAPSGWASSVPITPPPGFLRWDNVYFAAHTPGNTSLSVDVLSISGTLLISNVVSGGSLHSIDPVAHPAIRLRANLVRSADPTQTPRLDEWSVTWYPRPPDQHIRVFDELDTPIDGAHIYRNGEFIGATDDLGVFGFYPPTHTLNISDTLVALALVDEHPSFREAHQTWDSSQNWAFRTYVTNIEVADEGATYTHVVTQTGRQLLTVKESNPLVLFNLVVSIEWDATITYTRQISRAVQYASDYLYDVTDGQMAFGQVTIYDKAQHWASADFQISTKNTVRPYAFIGGITSDDTAHSIRVGRFWNGSSGNQGAWNEPYGYHTLIHEFGHYALYLYDEYFVRTVDENGHFTGEARTACTGLEVGPPPKDGSPDPFPEEPENASIMYYQYKASELADSDRWTVNCQNTEQARVNGEPDWQTVLAHYGGAEWELNTPSSRGSVMAGPEAFPDHLLPFPTIGVHDAGAGGAARQLMVLGSDDRPFPNALVALYTTPYSYTVAIDQGLTDRRGQLTIYGAVEGDTIQTVSFDGAYAGAVTVDASTSYTLTLSATSASGLAAQAGGSSPYLSLRPGSEGDTLMLEVHGAPAGSLPLSAMVIPGEGGGSPQSTPLVYSPGKGAYVGQVSFGGVGLGSGEVQVSGTAGGAGGQWISINSDYNLMQALDSQANDLVSEDGNFQLHIGAGSLLYHADAYAVVLPTGNVPGPLPEGMRVLGSAYEMRFSGAATGLTKPGVLTMYYHPEVMGVVSDLAIYHWDAADEEWERVGGEQIELDNSVAATVEQFGTYALMGEPLRVYLPIVLRQ